jgi:hypothetical protein
MGGQKTPVLPVEHGGTLVAQRETHRVSAAYKQNRYPDQQSDNPQPLLPRYHLVGMRSCRKRETVTHRVILLCYDPARCTAGCPMLTAWLSIQVQAMQVQAFSAGLRSFHIGAA